MELEEEYEDPEGQILTRNWCQAEEQKNHYLLCPGLLLVPSLPRSAIRAAQ